MKLPQTSNIKIIGLLSFLIIGTILFGGVKQAHALTVSPAKIEVSSDPGQTIHEEFLVINEQNQAETFYSSAENFQAQGESGTPDFVQGGGDLSSWITVPSQIVLQKGEEKKIDFTITIPKNAEPGGHFAAVFLSTTPPQTDKNAQVSVGAKIGVLVLLRVSGDIKQGENVLEFSTANNQKVFTSLPVTFEYRIKNTGDDRIEPAGELNIKDMVGLTAATIPANPTQGNVLPNSIRKLEVIWGADSMAQTATSTSSFFGAASYEWHHFAFGPYTAVLSLTYAGTTSKPLSDTIFIFPWQLIILILIVLFILFFLIRWIIRSYNRWIIAKAAATNTPKQL